MIVYFVGHQPPNQQQSASSHTVTPSIALSKCGDSHVATRNGPKLAAFNSAAKQHHTSTPSIALFSGEHDTPLPELDHINYFKNRF